MAILGRGAGPDASTADIVIALPKVTPLSVLRLNIIALVVRSAQTMEMFDPVTTICWNSEIPGLLLMLTGALNVLIVRKSGGEKDDDPRADPSVALAFMV